MDYIHAQNCFHCAIPTDLFTKSLFSIFPSNLSSKCNVTNLFFIKIYTYIVYLHLLVTL